MRKTVILLAIILLGSGSLFSQENPKINGDELISKASDPDQAKEEFKLAEKYYGKGFGTYDEALKYYLKLYGYNPDVAALNYKIGICYLLTSNKKAALSYLLNSKPDVAGDYYLALGKAYQYNLKYDDAKAVFENYLKSLPTKELSRQNTSVRQLIKECEFSTGLVTDSLPVFIINLGPLINSYYDDYGAVLGKNDSLIYFTSRRPENEPTNVVSRFKYKERVMVSNNCIYNKCDDVKELGVRKQQNVSLAGYNPKTDELYLYRGKRGNGNIWFSVDENGKWSRLKPLKGHLNHIAAKETSISVADDGTAYFVSDRRGGKGGKDIYQCKQVEPNKFSKPKNVGPLINTPFDEEGVSVTPDGNTLYFSSKGHASMGGFDVYRSTKQPDNSWGAPVNMGYPINSPADELFYHPTPDSMIALYSTVRESGFGGLDIYQAKKDPRIPFTLDGRVTDVKTGKVLAATVSVYDLTTSSLVATAQQDSIKELFSIGFEDQGFYQLQVNAPDYVTVIDTLNCPKVRHTAIRKNYQLARMKHPFTISGVVKDAKTGFPIQAELLLRIEGPDSTVYARQVSNAETGSYSFSLDDKYDVNITAVAADYFSLKGLFLTKKLAGNQLARDFTLTRSKVSYSLSGRITEAGTDTGIKATVSFYRANETTPLLAVTSNDSLQGKYNAVFEEKGPFKIEVSADGYLFINDGYQFTDTVDVAEKNMALQKIKVGVTFVMQNILFNTGAATLKPASYPELDKLVKIMNENPTIRIEVSGHTDNVGAAASNKKLSKARALSVKNYLVSKGIAEARIEYEGYGMEQPIADNKTKDGKAKNRRVEVKILE